MTDFIKTTEQDSIYRHLEKMSVHEILLNINQEDAKVAEAVFKSIPQIQVLIEAIVDKMILGGRLFYIGAGTSGRLALVDASECPPTFGVSDNVVIGVLAGGKEAMFSAIEFAEDDLEQAWIDLQKHSISNDDVVVGIAASGTTPYVIGGLKKCNEQGIVTGSISCNEHSPLSEVALYPIEVVVGPEFVTGSTRMKSGTAQKMILNMISTAVMIQLGRVEDNKMVNMQLTNDKLIDRGIKMIIQHHATLSYEEAKAILSRVGSIKKAIEFLNEK